MPDYVNNNNISGTSQLPGTTNTAVVRSKYQVLIPGINKEKRQGKKEKNRREEKEK